MMRRGEKGFSLIEVIAAITMVGTGLAAVMMTYSSSTKSMSFLQEKATAIYLLERKAEEIKVRGYDATDSPSEMMPYAAFPQYTFSMSLNTYDPLSEDLRLKKADLSILWNSSLGGTSSESITFLLAER